ncbi:MAG: hypothetical protein JWO22_3597 [Frankiales bacterium]|nr:hypothetical protein [Frankiales bacterium]
MTAPLRIANCSGFYGDRLAAAREMVEDGPIDVLTGDWLAELTMLILFKDRFKNPDGGFAKTFVRQMEQVMGTCLERGIKVVANAGGLNPAGCARAVETVAAALGLSPRIAHVTGDDVLPRLGDLGQLTNLDTGEPLGDRTVLTANAYLGGWGIVDALDRGADIVVTGRTTDAAIVMAPAAHHHRWARDDWDALAGALVAGHVIECGTQATGGNYAFFGEIPNLIHPGFPIAEIAADGSSVITKHESHTGAVTIGTVTAQLLYEIGSSAYLNPDVTARFDSIALTGEGKDRVRITGVKGEAPPLTSKVCLNLAGATKATYSFLLVGLDPEKKADLLVDGLFAALPGGRDYFDSVEIDLVRSDQEDPARNETAISQLRISLKDKDADKFGRALTGAITELALASYPGFFGGPSSSQAYGIYWPALMDSSLLTHEVTVGDEVVSVAPTLVDATTADVPAVARAAVPGGPVRKAPLGLVAGARSGDKGGNANLGVWVRTDEEYAWLEELLTVAKLKQLMPEAGRVERFELPNIRSLNFVLHGLLGEGVASSTRLDPQAKSLGEYLRAKHVEIPEAFL